MVLEFKAYSYPYSIMEFSSNYENLSLFFEKCREINKSGRCLQFEQWNGYYDNVGEKVWDVVFEGEGI